MVKSHNKDLVKTTLTLKHSATAVRTFTGR